MKYMTYEGRRYRIAAAAHCDRVIARGRGLPIYLPDGVTLDSPDLRARVIEAIKADRVRHSAATAALEASLGRANTSPESEGNHVRRTLAIGLGEVVAPAGAASDPAPAH